VTDAGSRQKWQKLKEELQEEFRFVKDIVTEIGQFKASFVQQRAAPAPAVITRDLGDGDPAVWPQPASRPAPVRRVPSCT
jgi:hypothetical protein